MGYAKRIGVNVSVHLIDRIVLVYLYVPIEKREVRLNGVIEIVLCHHVHQEDMVYTEDKKTVSELEIVQIGDKTINHTVTLPQKTKK